MTTHPHRIHLHRPRINRWVIAVVALSSALVGLGAWVLVDRTTSPSSTEGLAAPEVTTMLKDRVAALNSGDAKTIAAFYSRQAVLEERDIKPAAVTKGNEQIGERIGNTVRMFGMQLEPASPVIRLGNTVAEATRVPGYGDAGFILVYKLDADGRIAHQWVLPAS